MRSIERSSWSDQNLQKDPAAQLGVHPQTLRATLCVLLDSDGRLFTHCHEAGEVAVLSSLCSQNPPGASNACSVPLAVALLSRCTNAHTSSTLASSGGQ